MKYVKCAEISQSKYSHAHHSFAQLKSNMLPYSSGIKTFQTKLKFMYPTPYPISLPLKYNSQM